MRGSRVGGEGAAVIRVAAPMAILDIVLVMFHAGKVAFFETHGRCARTAIDGPVWALQRCEAIGSRSFKMNLSSREWLLACILDVCIKVIYTYCAFFLLTFLAVSVAPFVYVGVAISIFQFLCLFLAFSAAASLELVRVELPPAIGADPHQYAVRRKPKYALHDDDQAR